MQIALPFTRPRVRATDAGVLTAGSRSIPVRFVPSSRARRFIARILPDGSVRVTVPRRGTREEAWSFVRRHVAWIERERLLALQRSPAGLAWHAGCRLLLRGEWTNLVTVAEGADTRAVARLGELSAAVPRAAGDLRPFIEPLLRALARRELVPRLHELAVAHGLPVRRISIRGQRTRWGSCSTTGTIALNWRLVQMPPNVRDYVLFHELMHLREANHSRRFWRLIEQVCPAHHAARQWLKTHARVLN